MAGDWCNRLPMELSWVLKVINKFWIITINDFLSFLNWSRNELKEFDKLYLFSFVSWLLIDK